MGGLILPPQLVSGPSHHCHYCTNLSQDEASFWMRFVHMRLVNWMCALVLSRWSSLKFNTAACFCPWIPVPSYLFEPHLFSKTLVCLCASHLLFKVLQFSKIDGPLISLLLEWPLADIYWISCFKSGFLNGIMALFMIWFT